MNDRGDQREPHDSGNSISSSTLADLGVIYKEIPIEEDGKWEGEVEVFAKERGYKNVRRRPQNSLFVYHPAAFLIPGLIVSCCPDFHRASTTHRTCQLEQTACP